MSFASMQGRSMYIGSTIGEGALRFSDGTVQQTAYPGASGDITCKNLTVNETATINTLDVTGTATIGSSTNDNTTSLTIYGTVQQQLSANYCTQFGSNALTGGTNVNTGENNTAFGYSSMQNNSTGYSNTSFGDYSLNTNSTGSQNVAIGHTSQQYNQSGGQNTSVGCSSFSNSNSKDVSWNTCIGYNTNSYGNTNTAIGYNANCGGYSNSTALGQSSTNTASNQLMLGTSDETVTIPGDLIIDGSITSTLELNGLVSQVLSTSQSTQYGYNSLTQGTGSNNTAVGYNCMAANTTGQFNVAMGDNALTSNSTGTYNTAIGHFSQIYGTGGFNTAVGGSSLQGTVGSATGSYNTVVGYGACSAISSGEYNTELGYNSNTGTTTATNTTAIGYNSDCANFTDSTALGYNATNTASNQVMLGTSKETVQINGTLNVGTTSTYDTANVVNIYGGFNVNADQAENIPTVNNTIVGANNSLYAGTQNKFYAQENYFDAYTNYFTGAATILGDSQIGSSSSNTSTVNAVPNFVNGFRCAGANAYNLVMGIATYSSGGYNGDPSSIPPYTISAVYGDGNAYYNLDQTITNMIGCFINSQDTNFSMWSAGSTSTTQLYLSYVNLTNDYQALPLTVVYMAFCLT